MWALAPHLNQGAGVQALNVVTTGENCGDGHGVVSNLELAFIAVAGFRQREGRNFRDALLAEGANDLRVGAAAAMEP